MVMHAVHYHDAGKSDSSVFKVTIGKTKAFLLCPIDQSVNYPPFSGISDVTAILKEKLCFDQRTRGKTGQVKKRERPVPWEGQKRRFVA